MESSIQHIRNRVLTERYRPSPNFYESDRILQHLLRRELSTDAQDFIRDRLVWTGAQAAGPMNELSLLADKNGPELIKRNWLGENIDQIRFHPAYRELTRIALESGMFHVKWEPELRRRFRTERHRLGFGPGFLFAMSENGLYCPLCMTDGVARLIDRYADAAERERLLPHIYTQRVEDLYTGAMFLTEKAGGSDVGASQVRAEHFRDNRYRLYGEKWFCSNANGELIFALARTNPNVSGTRGLSIFLIERQLADGSPNPMDIIRLKDKLGVRSMASAEIMLTGAEGKLVGEEGQGFKIMADMINLSRLYNALTAVADTRRALIEAYQFLAARDTFAKQALDHALIREKLLELGSRYLGDFYLVWRAIRALDRADNGDERETALLRLLTPMVKKCTAENAVYSVRESMELMGGIGYIEDGLLPKIMRDCMVLPIWEGAGNIMTLDMLRASVKSEGLRVLFEEIRQLLEKDPATQRALLPELQRLSQLHQDLAQAEPSVVEATAKPFFERLTRLYQTALLLEYRDAESEGWVEVALPFWLRELLPGPVGLSHPPAKDAVEALIGWEC